MLAEVRERCDAIEECYEFMLAYAAQGSQVTKAAEPADKSENSCAALLRRWWGWQRAV